MHQALGGLVEVPLQITDQARAIIDDAEQQRLDPDAGTGEYLARGMIEIQMPKGTDMIDFEFETPDFQAFEPESRPGKDKREGPADTPS